MRYAIIMILVVLALSCVRNKVSDPIVLEVGDIAVSADQLKIAVSAVAKSFDEKLLVLPENQKMLREKVLDDLVAEQILVEEAARRLLMVTQEELDDEMSELGIEKPKKSQIRRDPALERHYEAWAQRVSNILLRRKVEDMLLKELVEVSPSEVSEYFQRNRKNYVRPSQCRFREIRTEEEASAREAKKSWKADEDFKALVAKYSSGPYKDRGGDTGYVDRDLLPTFLGRECDNLAIGQVSEVLNTPYGYYVVMLLDHRSAKDLKLEEVREDIEREIRRYKGQKALGEWLEQRKNETPIVVHEEVVNEIFH